MTPAARLSAAIEALDDIERRHRPAAQALKDWGLSHRFAGSGDRAAIAGLVYDALRRKASSAWIMGADYTIADIATVPWVNNLLTFYEAGELVGIDDFPEVTRVLRAFLDRPAVARGRQIPSRSAKA